MSIFPQQRSCDSDVHISRQPLPLSTQGFESLAMAQSYARQYRHESSMHAQAWPTDVPAPRDPRQHISASAADGFYPTTSYPSSSGGQQPIYAADPANSFSWSHQVPMEPLVTTDADLQSGPNSHLEYFGGVQGQTVVKSEGGYAGGLSYVPTRGQLELLRQVGVIDEADFETATSSPSGKSFFSDPSENSQAFSPKDGLQQAGAWVEYASTSPNQVKHSPSHDGGSRVQIFDEHLAHPTGGVMEVEQTNGIDMVPSVGQHHNRGFGHGWTIPVNHGPGGNGWAPSAYQQMPAGQPYYRRNVQAFQQNAIDYSTQARAEGPHRAYGQSSETHSNATTQDNHEVNSSAGSQAQRKKEDSLLLEGKALGWTYKQIRDKMGTAVAESTLRGRYRALTKERKDRVRKPVWRAEDVRLLRKVVAQEFDRLDDGYRGLDKGQRLSKISWKKVAEYIAENGGSYHFGNSTCKKKWSELEQHR